MSSTKKTRIFTTEEAIARLHKTVHSKAVNFYAMYSSVLGGIVTDPALMVLPLDDHMVHRGHAVFDTATLTHGMLYQLDPHLDRLLRSAELARIPLPFPREQLRQIILDTAAASGKRDGSVRYWLSAGPGGFALGPAECIGSSFYVIVFKQEFYPQSYYTEGVKVITSQVPIKPPLFARTKSTNYLPKCFGRAGSQRSRRRQWCVHRSARHGRRELQHECCLCHERPSVPPSVLRRNPLRHHHPADASARRASGAQRRSQRDPACGRSGQVKDVQAAEMMLIGSSIKVAPVVQWDGQPIGDGKPGPITKKLLQLWEEDTRSATDQLVPVPYA